MSDLDKEIERICMKNSLLKDACICTGRKDLLKLVEIIPEEMVPQAYKLLTSMLFCDKEMSQLQIQIDMRRKQLEQLIEALDQEGNQINVDTLLAKQYRGKKRQRKEVELYIAGLIDSLNNDIRTLNLLALFKGLYNSNCLPLFPNIESINRDTLTP